MIIHVTRDSVCMGDDTFDNSRDIEFDDNATVGSIIPVLNGRSFFPSVSGNDVMWVIENSRKKRILEYYTKLAKTEYKISEDMPLKDVCGDKLTLHCVYYANYRKSYKRGDILKKLFTVFVGTLLGDLVYEFVIKPKMKK